MSDKVTTEKLIQAQKPITGAQVRDWHLSLDMIIKAGWEYDRVNDVMMPPGSKGLISG